MEEKYFLFSIIHSWISIAVKGLRIGIKNTQRNNWIIGGEKKICEISSITPRKINCISKRNKVFPKLISKKTQIIDKMLLLSGSFSQLFFLIKNMRKSYKKSW